MAHNPIIDLHMSSCGSLAVHVLDVDRINYQCLYLIVWALCRQTHYLYILQRIYVFYGCGYSAAPLQCGIWELELNAMSNYICTS
jgi:hypothetical protein